MQHHFHNNSNKDKNLKGLTELFICLNNTPKKVIVTFNNIY